MGLLSRFDELHELAAQASGLDDFGAADYVEPMRQLLADYDRHNRIPPEGEALIAGDIIGQLVGRLFAQSGFKSHPEFAQAAIEKPLFVIGMARTGTTALLRLLSKDPAAQSLPLWLASTPMPRPPRETWESHPCYRQIAQGLRQLDEMLPEFKHIHPMVADEADECRIVLGQSFWSPGMASLATTSDYADWCLAGDARYAYRDYRRTLGLVAGGDRRRWVLKCPTHSWGLDALLDVFPDANIVFTHRDVTTSMASTASMVHCLRGTREPQVGPEQIGREILAHWGRALDKAEKVRQRYDPARFVDVHVRQMQTNPVGTVERIYRHFGLPFSAEARTAMARELGRDPRVGHGDHRYAPDYFGLDEHKVRAGVGDYWERNRAMEAVKEEK